MAWAPVFSLCACAADETYVPRMRLPPQDDSPPPVAVQDEADLEAAAVAPRPYTSAQIQAAMPVGFQARYQVEQPGRPLLISLTRVLSADATGVTLSQRMLHQDGSIAGEDEVSQESWDGLRNHASFPAQQTSISRERIELPSGSFDCLLYSVITSGEGRQLLSRFHFALDRPGAPVRYERVQDGQRTYLMTLLDSGVESAGG